MCSSLCSVILPTRLRLYHCQLPLFAPPLLVTLPSQRYAYAFSFEGRSCQPVSPLPFFAIRDSQKLWSRAPLGAFPIWGHKSRLYTYSRSRAPLAAFPICRYSSSIENSFHSHVRRLHVPSLNHLNNNGSGKNTSMTSRVCFIPVSFPLFFWEWRSEAGTEKLKSVTSSHRTRWRAAI